MSEHLTEERKRCLLQDEIKVSDLETFIETGSYKGDMIAAMLPVARRIYSVELHPERAAEVRERFKYPIIDGYLRFFEGDSAIALPWILERVDEPALIWLDAHHSDSDSAGDHDHCPLREELKACLASSIDHVIFCDDARFLGRGNWPTLAEITEMAVGWNVRVEDDIVRITRGK